MAELSKEKSFDGLAIFHLAPSNMAVLGLVTKQGEGAEGARLVFYREGHVLVLTTGFGVLRRALQLVVKPHERGVTEP